MTTIKLTRRNTIGYGSTSLPGAIVSQTYRGRVADIANIFESDVQTYRCTPGAGVGIRWAAALFTSDGRRILEPVAEVLSALADPDQREALVTVAE